MVKKATHRHHNPPTNCDICDAAIPREHGACFVDGKTQVGPWANMCIPCHVAEGVGLGTGRGQLYLYDADEGVFFKEEG